MASSSAKKKPGSSAKKPNILVIWGDDIGISNLSCYSRGLMGYQTPNIDRLANEGGGPDNITCVVADLVDGTPSDAGGFLFGAAAEASSSA